MPGFRKLVAIDFDGVIHSYTSPWTTAAEIADGPTPGAMAFLVELAEHPEFDAVIVSSRLSDRAGYDAVVAWIGRQLHEHLGDRVRADAVWAMIGFSVERPPAFLTIDDRAMRFEGTWPSLDQIAGFKPWNKRPAGASEVDELIARTQAAMARQDADLLAGLLRVLVGPTPDDPAFTWLDATVTVAESLEGEAKEAFDGGDPVAAAEGLAQCRRIVDGLAEVLRPHLARLAVEAGRSA